MPSISGTGPTSGYRPPAGHVDDDDDGDVDVDDDGDIDVDDDGDGEIYGAVRR